MESPRPTYADIVHAYLTEGYRAWQARDGASAAEVERILGLSVDEGISFRQELNALELLGPVTDRDDPGDCRLLPKGIALMDGSPTLDSLLALPTAALDRAAPTREAAESAKRGWRTIVFEWAVKRGLDVTWDNRRALWELLRARYPWLPTWPGASDGSV